MGNCTYCHTKAGLFKDAHETCIKNADAAREGLRTLLADAITSGKHPGDVEAQIVTLKNSGRLDDADAQAVMLKAIDKVTLTLAQNTPNSPDECDRIMSFYSATDKTWHDDVKSKVSWSGYVSLLHSGTLYEVLHRQIPYQNREAFSDFRLGKDEHPILRRLATLAEYKTVSTGRSYQSVGLPIGGGMYYRVGTSTPQRQQTGLMPVDEGVMVITTQAIIFSGQTRNFRLPYSSILRFEPFDDGFGVHENQGGGKVFIPALLGTMDEGWYFYNLVSALSKW